MTSEEQSSRELVPVEGTEVLSLLSEPGASTTDVGQFQPPVEQETMRWTTSTGVECVERVPANILPYLRVLDWNMTCDFFLRFGGGEIYLPKNPKKRGQVAQFIGGDAAARLASVLGNEDVRIPLANRFLARVLRAAGYSMADIARLTRQSDVTIRGHLKEPKKKTHLVRFTEEEI